MEIPLFIWEKKLFVLVPARIRADMTGLKTPAGLKLQASVFSV